jgi:predicted MFS family arabinose efflux permease
MVGIAAAPAAWVFWVATLLLGTGFYMIHGSIQAWVTEVAPHARGSAVALHAFSFFVGQSIGPAAFGVALHAAGVSVTMIGAGVALLVLAALLGRSQRQPR